MKSLKSIILCGLGVLALSLTSCNDWLDVNVDPNNPTDKITSYDQRLAHIEFYTNSGLQFGAWRTTMAMGDWTRNNGGGNYWHVSYWYPVEAQVTTVYQWWFVGAYANVPDMIAKAEAAENWQFAGAGYLIKAYGFMAMTDLYGEMPYEEAAADSPAPHYNTGKEIYLGCLETIDKAIEYLEKGQSQDPSLPTLAAGDFWNHGDLNKWIKLAYMLKARWINKLNKKGAGSYKDGKYDADEILRCLDKAMQSNADNTIVNHTDDNGPTHDVLGWDEPVDYSPLFSVSGMNSGYMATKMLYDNLTNFAGKGVEDPRADHILPWAYSPNRSENGIDAAGVKWNGHWRRTLGVDMSSEINSQGGPLRAMFNTETNSWYINSANEARKGDTVYIEGTSDCKGYFANPSILYCRAGSGKFQSAESGTFYTRVSSPTYIGTYAECCFIRAEVLFKKGDKAGAYAAYRAGIKASCELMNEKLRAWIAEDPSLADCPSFTPMTDDAINNFLNNGIGTQGDLSLGHILMQKRIALMFSYEIWNDMRRYDFDPNIFFGWSIPAYHYKVVAATNAIPEGKQYRRWRQCSHEYKYNSVNLQAIGEKVPGARMTDSEGNKVIWNTQDDAWTIPVWWDSDQE
ncbi:MAG: SusD/RagB family nutrient-binding outer membrane lipoprotein [Muribaculaceae bacterium]|nr:SusD/RagB family nutrient-binding outer membrane lipoprotein [Muribaculaceae bacterium]